jgi:membrane protease subunit HflK
MTDERQEDAARAALEATVSLSLRVLRVAMGVLAAIFLASGLFTVEPHEVALVRRLGSVQGTPEDRVLLPGAHWHWPVIDEVVRVPALLDERLSTDVFELEMRVKDLAGNVERKGGLDPERDGYLLTGDANIIHATVAAHYRIEDAYKFSRNARERDAETLARPLLERAIAKAGAGRSVDDLLTTKKEAFLEDVRSELQRSLDALDAGIRAGAVELARDFVPPPQVLTEFKGVAEAQKQHDVLISDARSKAAERVSGARSEAARVRDDALSESKRRTAALEADVAVFRALLPEWRRDKDALAARLLSEVLARAHPEESFVAPQGDLKLRLERDTNAVEERLFREARK